MCFWVTVKCCYKMLFFWTWALLPCGSVLFSGWGHTSNVWFCVSMDPSSSSRLNSVLSLRLTCIGPNAVFRRSERLGVVKWPIQWTRVNFPHWSWWSSFDLLSSHSSLSFLCVLCPAPSPLRRTREAVNPPWSAPRPAFSLFSSVSHPSSPLCPPQQLLENQARYLSLSAIWEVESCHLPIWPEWGGQRIECRFPTRLHHPYQQGREGVSGSGV